MPCILSVKTVFRRAAHLLCVLLGRNRVGAQKAGTTSLFGYLDVRSGTHNEALFERLGKPYNG